MRTIKFRAWDKVLKNMHYVIGLTFSFDVRSISKVQLTLSRTNDITYCEVMQFTGLKDKNGKEIYEGDIRRNINHYEGNGNTKPYYNYHKIVWDEKLSAWAAIHLNNTDESLTTNGNCFLYVYLKNSDSEHVGNIYEHPELLTTHAPKD